MLTFHVSDVRVTIDVPFPSVERTLEAIWGGAAPMMEARREARFTVDREPPYAVYLDGERVGEAGRRANLAPLVEARLYKAIPRWHRSPRLLLHAAALVHEGTTYLLPGVSNAGKSSLALALLETGASYLTDEMTVFDGARVWGVPRAIQFDPIPEGGSPPPWAAAADLDAYRSEAPDGSPLRLPLVRVDGRVHPAPVPASSVKLVFPRHGPHLRLRVLDPLDAFHRLLEARWGRLREDLGPLLGRGAVELEWARPADAVERLLAER